MIGSRWRCRCRSPCSTCTMIDLASRSASAPCRRSRSASEPPLQYGITETNVERSISKAANVSTMRRCVSAAVMSISRSTWRTKVSFRRSAHSDATWCSLQATCRCRFRSYALYTAAKPPVAMSSRMTKRPSEEPLRLAVPFSPGSWTCLPFRGKEGQSRISAGRLSASCARRSSATCVCTQRSSAFRSFSLSSFSRASKILRSFSDSSKSSSSSASSSPPPPPPLALPALAFRLLSAFSSSDSAALRSSRARSRALSSTIAVPSLSTNDDEKLPAPSCASVPSRTDSRARRSRCSPRSLKAACRSASRSASTPARFAARSASCSPRTAATSARRSCIAPDAASASAFALSASALAASVSPRLFASSSRSRAFSASSRPLSASAAAPVGFPAAVAGDTPAGGGRSFGA
mmetsp:Transcript_36588/g.114981  ORF Transcript_36588/g.114981 Transcript_36588/m.114981 type:complete len:408 (-) Transcript_36588:423-1646(-)